MPTDPLVSAYEDILDGVLPDGSYPGVEETPERAAKAMREMTSGYSTDIAALFKTFDSEGYNELVAAVDIPFASLCEHHALPFLGRAHVIYIPDGRVIGLSKIPRLVDAFSRRLQLQERMTQQIADTMVEYLAPAGVMVVVEAEHACATIRGVRKAGMLMRTSAVRGAFADNPESRAEALDLIRR